MLTASKDAPGSPGPLAELRAARKHIEELKASLAAATSKCQLARARIEELEATPRKEAQGLEALQKALAQAEQVASDAKAEVEQLRKTSESATRTSDIEIKRLRARVEELERGQKGKRR